MLSVAVLIFIASASSARAQSTGQNKGDGLLSGFNSRPLRIDDKQALEPVLTFWTSVSKLITASTPSQIPISLLPVASVRNGACSADPGLTKIKSKCSVICRRLTTTTPITGCRCLFTDDEVSYGSGKQGVNRGHSTIRSKEHI